MFVGATQANTLLSQHMHASEQGFAMGTLDSVRSLVGACGPLLFSQLFSLCGKQWDAPQVPFVVGMFLVAAAIGVITGPLRASLKRDALAALFVEEGVEHAADHGGLERGFLEADASALPL